jgi:hypothetical protein
MSYQHLPRLALLLGALPLFGCQGQQYVNPETVALIVKNDSTGMERVNRCNYVPVLLGSQVKVRYVVEGDLKATISVTRDNISVTFEGSSDTLAPFEITPKHLMEQKSATDDMPPAGYSVDLASGCTPEDG